MIGRLVLAALIAGMAAGFIYGGVQHVRTTPLILAAEVFETAPAHDHAAGTPEHSHDAAATAAATAPAQEPEAEEWAPADGWPRTFSTTLASVITGAGFAILLAGVSLLTGISHHAKERADMGAMRFSGGNSCARCRACSRTAGNACRRFGFTPDLVGGNNHRHGGRHIPDCHKARTPLAGGSSCSHRPAPHHRCAPAAHP